MCPEGEIRHAGASPDGGAVNVLGLLVRPNCHVRAEKREGEVFGTSISDSFSRSWTVWSTNVWVEMRSAMASVSALAPTLGSFAAGKGLMSVARTKSFASVPTASGCPVGGDMWGAQACHINSAAAGSYSMDKNLTACFCASPSSCDKTAMRTEMWSIMSWLGSGRCEEATKVVIASLRVDGSSSVNGSYSGASSGLTVHVVSVAVCLAGGPPLLEAPVSSMSVCSSAARRFCPEEAGRGAVGFGRAGRDKEGS